MNLNVSIETHTNDNHSVYPNYSPLKKKNNNDDIVSNLKSPVKRQGD